MYVSFKARFDRCNKMSLSVKWYRCLDLVIYTDLFTLMKLFNDEFINRWTVQYRVNFSLDTIDSFLGTWE